MLCPCSQILRSKAIYLYHHRCFKYAVGAVTKQLEEKQTRPVCFLSKVLNGPEQNYLDYERELISIVYTFRVWRPYLRGKSIAVESTHYLMRFLEAQSHPSSKQAGWLETSLQSDFKICPLSGKSDVVAGALSRLPRNVTASRQKTSELPKQAIRKKSTPQVNRFSAISFKPPEFVGLAQNYKEDKKFRARYKKPSGPFHRDRLLLYYHGKLCVPLGSFFESFT